MNHTELVKKVLDELAKEHGTETFVAQGFAYYEDAHEAFTKLLVEETTKAATTRQEVQDDER